MHRIILIAILFSAATSALAQTDPQANNAVELKPVVDKASHSQSSVAADNKPHGRSGRSS